MCPAEDVFSDLEASSTSPASSEGGDGDDGEDGEEEDPDEDVSGPVSQTSTRSRSRRRQHGGEPSPASPASGDPSFDPTAALHLSCVKASAWVDDCPQGNDELLSKLASACVSSGTALTVNSCLCSGNILSAVECQLRRVAFLTLLTILCLGIPMRQIGQQVKTETGEPFDRTPLRPPAPVYAAPLPEAPMQQWQEASVHLVV